MEKCTINVYVLDEENATAYIPLIRKFTQKGISEIKREIHCKEPIVICQYTQMPEELKELSYLLRALTEKGAKIKIVENIKNKVLREITMDIISNLIQRRNEIEQEVASTIDLEVGEE